jgi:benzoate-CoA ligase family protein
MVKIPEQVNVASWCIDRVARTHGHRVAVAGEPAPVRYEELRCLTNRVGNALKAMGCAPGARVLIALPDSVEFIASFFGIVKIGAVAVPVNVLGTSTDFAHYLENSGACIAFVHTLAMERFAAAVSENVEIVVVGDEASNANARSWEHLLSGADTELEPYPSSAHDPAFILYTSGSTGLAKGVVHAHQSMIAISRSFADGVLEIGPEDRTLSVSKLFFAYGLGNGMYFPLAAGASTVLNPQRATLNNIADLIARYRPTLFFAVPAFYRTLLQELPHGLQVDFSSVRLALSAGEPLPKEIFDAFYARFNLTILDGLGSTEMLQTFICNRPQQLCAGSCGIEVPDYEVRLMDDEGAPVADGEVGTLWVKGASAFIEYWNNPELTARTKKDEWIITRDKLIRDADGYLHFCGRTDDMLKVSGKWVSPIAVESALAKYPGIERVVALPKEDALGRRRLVAYVVLTDGSATRLREVSRYLRGHLPEHMAAECVRVGSIPLTPNGKPDRAALLSMASQ